MPQDAKPLGPVRDHFWLVQGMAKAVGADIGGAWLDGRIDSEGWAGMVTACRGCGQPGACRKLLDEGREDRIDPPSYCENADLLEDLARD